MKRSHKKGLLKKTSAQHYLNVFVQGFKSVSTLLINFQDSEN